MTVWVGMRKLSDANRGCLAELGNLGTPTSGSWFINAPLNALSPDCSFASGGTATTNATYINSAIASPVTNVLTGIGNISGPVATLRSNGTQVATRTTTQGTGNYGNYPLYIGARAGTSLFFNGQLYSLIVRGATSTSAQITAAETWVNTKTGAY